MAREVIPQSPDELEDMLLDPKKMTNIFKDKSTAKEFMNSYTANVLAKDPGYKLSLMRLFSLVWLSSLRITESLRPLLTLP